MSDSSISKLNCALANSRSVLIVCGAGTSAESGVPTFRGTTRSWWSGLLGYPILLVFGTPWGWEWLPWLVWPLFRIFMRRTMRRAEPNAFHELAVRLHDAGKDVLVVTQNIDGLFQRAGLPPQNVIEQHGTVQTNICSRCLKPVDGDAYCGACGGWPRPAALLFGDRWFPEADITPALKMSHDTVVIIAGLSGMVSSADPILNARIGRRDGAHVFNINPLPNRYDGPRIECIRMGCAEVAKKINL